MGKNLIAMSLPELRFTDHLYQLIKKKHRACYLKALALLHSIEVKAIVEIGVFKGKNARMLRELFPEAHLYLVDPWSPDFSYLSQGGPVAAQREVYTKAFSNVKTMFKNDLRTTIIRKPSNAAAPDIPNDIDLIFIDANHDYSCVKQNIITYLPKLRSRSILAGHNYGHQRLPGVKQAVDEIFGSNCYLGQDFVWAYLADHQRSHRRGLEPPTT
ncbi:MAG: class I SAM-dependent methyltransferase [Chlamydiota bacterium]